MTTTTLTDLFERIRNGESSGTEFKRDVVRIEDLAREIVAFANFEGGAVLLGVEDDGSVSGIVRPGLEEWVMNACRDKIRPAIIPFYELFKNVEPGKDVAVVRVNQGLDVHALWHNNRLTYYIRVGTQTRETSTEELGRLFQQRGAVRAELTPISGARESDMDVRRLRDYFSQVRKQEVPETDDGDDWRSLLVNTEIMVEEGVTLAGLILFGRNPNRFLPQAGIDATAFLGIEKDYAARERATLRGPLTPFLDAGRHIVETGIVEQAVEFVSRNTGVSASLVDGVRRVDRHAYPEAAVREAIVNAVIHRDYLLHNTDIELAVYDDRLEVVSPGRLPNGITPSRMRAGCRSSRNQLIKDVMRDYGYLEHMGLGVPRKIVREMKLHNGTDPELIEDGEQFTVRLWK